MHGGLGGCRAIFLSPGRCRRPGSAQPVALPLTPRSQRIHDAMAWHERASAAHHLGAPACRWTAAAGICNAVGELCLKSWWRGVLPVFEHCSFSALGSCFFRAQITDVRALVDQSFFWQPKKLIINMYRQILNFLAKLNGQEVRQREVEKGFLAASGRLPSWHGGSTCYWYCHILPTCTGRKRRTGTGHQNLLFISNDCIQ